MTVKSDLSAIETESGLFVKPFQLPGCPQITLIYTDEGLDILHAPHNWIFRFYFILPDC